MIGHDNQGVDPSWFLEEVEVDVLETGDHYLFPCGRWLRVTNGTDETETILYPGKGKLFIRQLLNFYRMIKFNLDLNDR